jgi:predicted O-methyltransferase YrrM
MLNNQSKMELYARNNNIPIMQAEGIDFLINYLQANNIQSVLEIGSAIGYSALMMVANVPGLVVETLEIDESRYQQALSYIAEAGYEQQIIIHHQDALTFSTSKKYDLLFIDGAKAQYQKFFDRFAPQAIVTLVDNMDFHGMVNDVQAIKNRNTRSLVRKIIAFRQHITQLSEYQVNYHSVGDGVLEIKRVPQTK